MSKQELTPEQKAALRELKATVLGAAKRFLLTLIEAEKAKSLPKEVTPDDTEGYKVLGITESLSKTIEGEETQGKTVLNFLVQDETARRMFPQGLPCPEGFRASYDECIPIEPVSPLFLEQIADEEAGYDGPIPAYEGLTDSGKEYPTKPHPIVDLNEWKQGKKVEPNEGA